MKLIRFDKDVLRLDIVPVDLEKKINELWINDIKRGVNFRKYLKLIKNTLQVLSKKIERSQADIERACLRYGVRYISQVGEVEKLKSTRMYILNNFYETDDIRMIENRFFDLGTSDAKRHHVWIPEGDMDDCKKLSSTFGISYSVTHQIAVMLTLVHASVCPVQYHNPMLKIIARFSRKLKTWVEQSVEVEKMVRRKVAKYGIEPRMEIEDFPELIDLFTWTPEIICNDEHSGTGSTSIHGHNEPEGTEGA